MAILTDLSMISTVTRCGLRVLLALTLLLFACPAWAADVVGMGPTADRSTTTNPAGSTVEALLNNTTAVDSSVTGIAVGTSNYGDSNTSLTNAGTVSVQHSATQSHDRVYGINDNTRMATLTNTGKVSVISESSGTGRHNGVGGIQTYNGTVNNSGEVTVSATTTSSANSHGATYGIYAETIDNSGTVKVTSTATAANPKNAMGLWISPSGSLSNSGTVTVIGTNSQYVRGISSNSLSNTNSGTVTAHATTAVDDVYGAYIVETNAALTNTGTIAASGGNNAYGVWLNRTGQTLHNYGTISATGGATNNYAIYANATSRIHLHSGSQVSGQIYSNDAGSALYLYGSGSGYDIAGTWARLYKEDAGTMTLGTVADNAFVDLYVRGGTLALNHNLVLNGGSANIASGAALDLGLYNLNSEINLINGSTLKTTLHSDGATCGSTSGTINGGTAATTLSLSHSGAVETATYTIAPTVNNYNNILFSNSQQTMSSLFGNYAMDNTGGALRVQVTEVTDAELAAKGINPDDAHAMQTAFQNDQASMDKLNNMGTDKAKDALDQAHAEPMQGTMTALLNSELAARGVIAGRLLAARSAAVASGEGATGLSSGSDELAWKVWGQGFGSAASESAHGNSNGYDANTAGLTFGIDRAFTDALRLGLAYSYMNTSVDAKDSSNNNDVESNLLTLYGEMVFADEVYLNGHISYALNHYDIERYMTVMGLMADARTDGSTFNVGGEFGKSFSLSETMVQAPVILTPYLGMDYSYISIDSYEESGAGSSNLIVDNTDINVFTTTLGARLAATFDTVTAEIHAAWLHDWAQEKLTSSARFATGGAALSSDAVSTDADKINLGVGVAWQLSDVCTLDFTADYLGNEHMDSFGGTAKVSYEF